MYSFLKKNNNNFDINVKCYGSIFKIFFLNGIFLLNKE